MTSDRLFERAHSFTNIQMKLHVRLLVLKARRMLYILLCKEGKRLEGQLGSGNQSGYLDTIIKSCLAGQRARL